MLKKSLVLLAMLALVSSAQANLFVNGDAEIGGDATTPPDGWDEHYLAGHEGGNVGVSSDTPDGSSQSVELVGDDQPGYDYATQCFLYSYGDYGGDEMTISFDYKGDIYCGLYNNNYAGQAAFIWDRVTEWTHYEVTFTVDEGTTRLHFGMYDNSGGPGNQLNSAWFDNVVLTPEPATMTLIGLGGLALIRRRRK